MAEGRYPGPLERLEEEQLDQEMHQLNISVSVVPLIPDLFPNSIQNATDTQSFVSTSSPKSTSVACTNVNTSSPINSNLSVDLEPNSVQKTRPNKRDRHDSLASTSSSESLSRKPSLKMARITSPVKQTNRVHFVLQHNNNEDGNDDSGASTHQQPQAAAHAPAGNEAAGASSANNGVLSTYQVNGMALPMWRSARNNRLAETKAGLRADMIENLLEHDTIPAFCYGADKLPAYLLPLSPPMADLIRQQGRDLAKMAIEDLRSRQTTAHTRMESHTKIWRDLYVQEGDNTTDQAAALADDLVTHFKKLEVKRLGDFVSKEMARRPLTNDDLGKLVCKDFQTPNKTPTQTNPRNNNQERPNSRPSSNERSRKRARPSSREKRSGPPAAQQSARANTQPTSSATRGPNSNNRPSRQDQHQPTNNNNPRGPRQPQRGGPNQGQQQAQSRDRGRPNGPRMSPGARDIMDAIQAFSTFWHSNN